MSDNDLVNRVAQVLTDLKFLSEAKASKPAGDKLSGQHPGGDAPSGIGHGSEADFHRRSITRAVENAEEAVRRAKQREAPKPDLAFWVLQEEGRDSRDVAERHGTSVDRVRQIRENAKRDRTTGRPLA